MGYERHEDLAISNGFIFCKLMQNEYLLKELLIRPEREEAGEEGIQLGKEEGFGLGTLAAAVSSIRSLMSRQKPVLEELGYSGELVEEIRMQISDKDPQHNRWIMKRDMFPFF